MKTPLNRCFFYALVDVQPIHYRLHHRGFLQNIKKHTQFTLITTETAKKPGPKQALLQVQFAASVKIPASATLGATRLSVRKCFKCCEC